MSYILHIETSTTVCSVALSKDGNLIGLKESNEQKSHASLLAIFVETLLKENNINANQLAAVSVSKGPGSYTGLRIGVSTAKGIAYGANIPLIAVHTLQAMTAGILSDEKFKAYADKGYAYVPMIDARRMEVYSAIFDYNNTKTREIKAEIIESDSFGEVLNKQKTVFFGDGASKCKTIIEHPNAIFVEEFFPSAKYMLPLSQEAFEIGKFEDVAYFEPFYLKDFVATTPKKNLLQ